MPEQPDMSAPVTRAELRDELQKYATKFDLDNWGSAILEKMDQRFVAMDQRFVAMDQRFNLLHERLSSELGNDLARHTNAILEALKTLVSGVDEKYNDLPDRVARLEAKVPGPKRGRRS